MIALPDIIHRLALVTVAIALTCAHQAQSQDSPTADAPPESTIEAVPAPPSDERIATRLLGIYQEIDALKSLAVEVNQGVVTVSGTLANEADTESAVRLAKRIEGVVTVESKIERSLEVGQNLTPRIEKYKSDLAKLIRGIPLLLFAVAVFFIIALIGHWLAKRRRLWEKISPNPFLAELLAQALRATFIALALVAALNLVGATALVGTVLGGAGVVGLAIGFAIRDTMENYISSIMLSLRQPFRANDHVVIGDEEGIVVRLTSRATILMTRDGNHLRIPNSNVFKAVILNYTRNPERRFGFILGVDAEDDPLAAMNTGLAVIETLPFVIGEPKPKAIIETVGDSNISLKFTAWINQTDTDFETGRSLAIRATKDALEAAGFTLPEPIYRLRFDQAIPGLTDSPTGATLSTQDSPTPRPESPPRTTAVPEDITSIDTRPDTHLEQRVSQERVQSGENDLLDSDRPIE